MGIHFSSKSNEWETPQWLFDDLNKEFGFVLDAAATRGNKKCDRWIGEDFPCGAGGALGCDHWGVHSSGGPIWLNPPYGRKVGKFIKHAYQQSIKGNVTVVCLVAARTCTLWWHLWAMKADEIRFIKGRLRFGNAKHPASFPSVILIFGKAYMKGAK